MEGGPQDPTERGCGFTSGVVARHRVQPAKKNPPDARLWVGYKVRRYKNGWEDKKKMSKPRGEIDKSGVVPQGVSTY